MDCSPQPPLVGYVLILFSLLLKEFSIEHNLIYLLFWLLLIVLLEFYACIFAQVCLTGHTQFPSSRYSPVPSAIPFTIAFQLLFCISSPVHLLLTD